MGKTGRLVTNFVKAVTGGGLYAVGVMALVGLGAGALAYPDLIGSFAEASLPASAGSFTPSSTVAAGVGVGIVGAAAMNSGLKIGANPV